MYPWICGRCAREFTHDNLRELTVHHRDHNHDNNPADGSNWGLLCVYCHDNEHARYVEAGHDESSKDGRETSATYNPFADLTELLKPKNNLRSRSRNGAARPPRCPQESFPDASGA